MNNKLYAVEADVISGLGIVEDMTVYVWSENFFSGCVEISKAFADKNVMATNVSNPKYTAEDVHIFKLSKETMNKFYSNSIEDMFISRSLYIKAGISVNLQLMKNKGQTFITLSADFNNYDLPGVTGTGIIQDKLENVFTTVVEVPDNFGNTVSALVLIVVE